MYPFHHDFFITFFFISMIFLLPCCVLGWFWHFFCVLKPKGKVEVLEFGATMTPFILVVNMQLIYFIVLFFFYRMSFSSFWFFEFFKLTDLQSTLKIFVLFASLPTIERNSFSFPTFVQPKRQELILN